MWAAIEELCCSVPLEIHLKISRGTDLVHQTEIIMLIIHVSEGEYNLENVDMKFAYRQHLDSKYI